MVTYELVLCVCSLFAASKSGHLLELHTNVEGLSLHTKVLACYRNGPFVVAVTLSNATDQPIHVDFFSAVKLNVKGTAQVEIQKYLRRRDAGLSITAQIGTRPVDNLKGEPRASGAASESAKKDVNEIVGAKSDLTRQFYFHQDHTLLNQISRIDVSLAGSLSRDGKPTVPLLARESLRVVPLEFSPDRRRKMAAELIKRLDERPSAEAIDDVCGWVLGTFCPEFVPVVLRLLREPGVSAHELIDHIYLSSTNIDDAFQLLRHELSKPDNPSVIKCFDYWRDAAHFQSRITELEQELRSPHPQSPIPVSDPFAKARAETRFALRKMAESDLQRYKAIDKARHEINSCPSPNQIRLLFDLANPWAGAVAGVYFAEFVDSTALNTIARKLNARLLPPSEDEWKRIVTMLKDKRYATRELGKTEVMRFGERTASRVDKLTRTTSEADLLSILSTLRSAITKTPVPWADEWVLVECANQRNAVSERLLREITKLDDSPVLSSRAARILEQWRDNDERMKRIRAMKSKQ